MSIRVSNLLIACLLAALEATLGAQGVLKRQDQVVWRDQDLVYIPNDPNSSRGPAEFQTKAGKSRNLPPLPKQSGQGKDIGKSNGMGLHVVGERIYYMHADLLESPGQEPGKTERKLKISVYPFNEKAWTWEPEPSGTLTWHKGIKAFLLQEDLILGVATSAKSFEQDGKSHLFAVFRKGDDGVFRLKSFPDNGLSKPVFTSDKNWHYPALANLWLSHKTARTPWQFLLASGFGTCWLFDVRTGSLLSLSQIYKGINEEKLVSGEVWGGALLCVQPKADGDFLISALDEYAITQGWHMDRSDHLPSSAPAAERFAAIQQAQSAILRSNPRVDWYLLDREQRRFLPEIPPQGLPRLIQSAEDLQTFDWTFKPDGNLAFRGRAFQPTGDKAIEKSDKNVASPRR